MHMQPTDEQLAAIQTLYNDATRAAHALQRVADGIHSLRAPVITQPDPQAIADDLLGAGVAIDTFRRRIDALLPTIL